MDIDKKTKTSKIIIKFLCITSILLMVIFTFLFIKNNNKIINEKIEKVTIKYYEKYNIATGESLEDIPGIDLIEINLSGKDLKIVSKLLSNIKEDKSYYDCECIIGDEALIIINDKYQLTLGLDFGEFTNLTNNNKIIVGISQELYDSIKQIIKDNNSKLANNN